MDTFNNLPNDIIYQIFSLLPKNGVVKIQSLSKKARKLSLTSPYLSFALENCTKSCKTFYNFLDNFWESVREINDVESFYIDRLSVICTRKGCTCGCNAFDIDSWIEEALAYKIRELDLNVRVYCCSLPTRSVSCESLTVLKIDAEVVFLSKGILFKSLRDLSLRNPQVINYGELYAGDSLSQWISRSCPSLKKLSIQNYEYSFYFTNPSLEELTMTTYDRCIERAFFDIYVKTEKLRMLHLQLPYWSKDIKHKIHVTAPNLHDFKFRAQFNDEKFAPEFPLLNSTSISLLLCDYMNVSVPLYRSIRFAQKLEANYEACKAIFMDKQCKEIMCGNLQYLVVKISEVFFEGDDYVSTIFSILKQLKKLKSLVIKHVFKPNTSSIVEDGGPLHDLTVLKSLEEVTLELIMVSVKETEFIKYLLKYVVNLKRFEIVYAENLGSQVLGMNLQNFEKGSASAEIFLTEKALADMEVEEDL